MTPFHLKASDGLRIHGYLTLPRRSAAGSPPPLVVLSHGGPHWIRDGWGFNPEVQLFASRGFAVLQVNYRGSGGYGEAYQEAGYRHWGDRVVQDVIDATRHLAASGKVDGKRICAYGGSFGAYAALQGAVLAPDLFRCVVGVAGVYDLGLMGKADDIALSAMGRSFVRQVLGEDEAELKRFSPVHRAAAIAARVLLVHGGRDERAPIEHAERLRDALTKAGRPPEWLEEPTEGHGFYDEAARERMYRKVLEFMEASVATAPPAPAPAPR